MQTIFRIDLDGLTAARRSTTNPCDLFQVFVLEERGDLLQPRPTLGSLATALTQSLQHRPSAKAALVGELLRNSFT